jgi:SAM-dependent methyltransferase
MKCRFCGKELSYVFADLGNAPPSNAFLKQEQLNEPEVFYPLKLFVCDRCFLVQVDEYKKSDEIFNNEYAYFSSYSKTWLENAKQYADLIVSRFPLNQKSLIIEIASNDGYLLQYFKEKALHVLGIEPAKNTAQIAKSKAIDTIEDFFGETLAQGLVKEHRKADLLIGNNVLAHVPNIHDFVKGLKILLKDDGVITMEFPHIMRLIEHNQFDTIYHEHFSYFSFMTVKSIFESYKLTIFDVDELSTHGGSLRIYASHEQNKNRPISGAVNALLEKEYSKGMNKIDFYLNFQDRINKVKNEFLRFLIEQRWMDKKIIAYGAAAKGNTFLNYCGIKKDLIEFVVDASPHKQGKLLPASHIPVVDESRIKAYKPDFVVILPWNIKEEIMTQLSYIREWGARFVMAIPELQIL